MSGIEFCDVSKSYDGGRTFVVSHLNLTVEKGEFLVLLGSSGSGKTTTLKMINRLDEPTSGVIKIDGTNILERDPIELRRSIGYVFQGIGLFPHLTVIENVAMVPKLLGWKKQKYLERGRELLDLIGLPPEQFGERLPEQLSGGQQQRVGVARALAAEPDYLLMDEPFGALDAVVRDKLQQELLQIHQRFRKTIIFVTHDLFEALALADRIAIFDAGKLEQVDAKDHILKNPATDFVRSLFEKPAQQLAQFRGLS